MAHQHFIPAAGHDWFLPVYDPLQRLLGAKRIFSRLIEVAGLDNGQHILDVGCGTGNLAIAIKQALPDANVVALDPDPKALERAEAKARKESVAVNFEEGFAERLPFESASFDRVLSTLMFHHLSAEVKQATLTEARRVLKDDGALFVLDFGGGQARSDGLLARALHRSDSVEANYSDGIAARMIEAGFASASAVDTQPTLVGRITTYRGSDRGSYRGSYRRSDQP